MAEYCLECFNKLCGTHYTKRQVVIDYKELDLCESCGELKPCIVRVRRKPIERIEAILRRVLK